MKIINRLKAIFNMGQQPIVLDLAAAEIKAGRAYLHPKGDRKTTYQVRSDDIEIYLSRNKELSDEDIRILKRKEDKATDIKDKQKDKKEGSNNSRLTNSDEMYDRFKKKTFSVTLYQQEYDALMSTIREYGYKRAEFIMASANTATRGTMDRERKKIVRVHKEMRIEEKSARAAKKAT